ncbi:MAG: hypothetical protein JKX88_10645 [Marinicaulis sp.]|nr:hypothetical protein [Marinicaulis sp.]
MPATIRKGFPVWATLFIEFLLVIAAVMLALWAGEWVKSNERKQSAATALENIYYEIRGNKQYLEQLHQRHKDYAENFDERFDAMVAIDPLTASSEEVWAANLIPFRGWDAAWRLAQAGGVLSEVNYEYAVAITSAYGIQEIYADYGKEYLSVAFNLDYVDPDKIDQVRDSIKATLASFIIFNQTLLNQYDVALTKLEEHPDLNITKS